LRLAKDTGATRAERTKERSIRNHAYDTSARKRTVSLTLNADLYAKPKGGGINL
jgi:hypothetical protein